MSIWLRRVEMHMSARLTQLVERHLSVHRLRLGLCPLHIRGGHFVGQLREFLIHHSGLTLGVATQEQGLSLGGLLELNNGLGTSVPKFIPFPPQ
jgi:hypothetical protein